MSSPSAPLGTLSPGLDALLHRAAFAPIENVGWIRVTGSDRVRWLNGMVTNNIAALKPGEGCYNFFLNAQGRIQADCTAWMQEDSILLETASPGSLATMLDHFIIMDDVELDVVESSDSDRKWFAKNQPGHPPPFNRAGILIAGPTASAALSLLSFRSAAEESAFILPPRMASKPCIWKDSTVDVLHNDNSAVSAIEIWSDPATVTRLSATLGSAKITQASREDLEHLRILSGNPLYGTDIRDKDLPQETNQDTRALHFAKGCYLGQEIVERIRSRGAVHRTFMGFLLTGAPAKPGTVLTADDKPVGELTSVASFNSQLTTDNSQLALGYLRREVLTRGASIQYPGGTAVPTELPFSL